MAESMNKRGIFVVSFSFPVVPRGQARIRVQISAAHTREQLDTVLSAFEESGREQGSSRSCRQSPSSHENGRQPP